MKNTNNRTLKTTRTKSKSGLHVHLGFVWLDKQFTNEDTFTNFENQLKSIDEEERIAKNVRKDSYTKKYGRKNTLRKVWE